MKQRKLTIRIRRDTRAALTELGREFVRSWKTGKTSGDMLEFESPLVLNGTKLSVNIEAMRPLSRLRERDRERALEPSFQPCI